MLLCAAALASTSLAWADEKFEFVSVRLEQNLSDNDAEVIFEATSGAVGLAALKVVGPDGRTFIDFKSPESKMGIRHFNLESPEPKELAKLQAAFPAGEYTFTGVTVGGAKLSSKATLSHKLPGVASFVRPSPNEENVPVKGFEVKWGAGKDSATHVVTIENEQTGVKVIQAILPGAATSLLVPDSFLTAGTKYKVSIGAVTRGGNGTFVETAFTTARK